MSSVSRRGVSPTPLDKRPLSEDEQALIRAAETYPWTAALRYGLAQACIMRGLLVGAYDAPDELVEALEALADG